MSGRRVINRQLEDVVLDSMEGCGSTITVKLRGYRKTKAGTAEIYHLTLQCCRYSVLQILNGLKAMHGRDRERIEAELKRIEKESNVLKENA